MAEAARRAAGGCQTEELKMCAAQSQEIPGTTLFDGALAQKGYALNRMCYSFNSAANRDEFRRDEDAYRRKFGFE